MIKDNTEDLIDRIEEVLYKGAYMQMGADIFPLIPDLEKNPNIAIAKFNSKANVAPDVTRYVEPYMNDSTDAMRKIIEVIVKETMNYVIANAELAAAKRYDDLEADFNNLLIGLNAVATQISAITVSVPGTAAGTALVATINSCGGITRAVTKTEATKITEEQVLPSTDRIYIK